MDLPQHSLKVTPKSSENNKSGIEMICFWNRNTKVTVKMTKCLIETVLKKGNGHNSLIVEYFLAKVICKFCLSFSFLFWKRIGGCGLGESNKVNMKQT